MVLNLLDINATHMTKTTQPRQGSTMDTGLKTAIEDFSQFIQTVNSQEIPVFKDTFFNKIDRIARLIEQSNNEDEWREKFFNMCSTLNDSMLHYRTREKPLGYAGDFLLIDWIYTQKKADSKHGSFFDELFHNFEAARAVRNRKQFFIEKCKALTSNASGPFTVLDLGCGSCRDVLETFEQVDNWDNLYFHCVDQEPRAIAYAEELFKNKPFRHHIHLENSNIFFLHKKQQYPLIWSAGLFDYLDDRTIRVLLKKLWRILCPGGSITFGNFSPENPTRNGMELVGKWFLIHRSAEELLDIAQNAGIPYSRIDIESEPEGVNLFCTITK